MTITAERLRELLNYDAETGVFTNRTHRSHSRMPAGAVAGSVISTGYLRVVIDAKAHLCHRLAWLYVYGRWPDNSIDHINGIRSDNRISNLRDVPHSVNMQNGVARGTKYGYPGIMYSKGSYFGKVKVQGRRIYTKAYPTPELAHRGWLELKSELHAECRRHL